MPVVVKSSLSKLVHELNIRMHDVQRMLEHRPLHNNGEGCKDGMAWPEPKEMVATRGGETEIRLAVDTLKAVLGEVRKLKTPTAPKANESKPAPMSQSRPLNAAEPKA